LQKKKKETGRLPDTVVLLRAKSQNGTNSANNETIEKPKPELNEASQSISFGRNFERDDPDNV